MNTARIQNVLLDIDGPQLLILRDNVDGTWLALAVTRQPSGDEFLCVQVSPARLAAFRHGDIDLLSMFTDPEVGKLSRMFIDAEATPETRIDLIELSDAPPPAWLPDPQFLLTDFVPTASEGAVEIVDAAQVKNRAIVYLTLNPPEAKVTPKIEADRLASALHLFQNFTRHAYYRSLKPLSGPTKKLRKSADNFTYEVYNFHPGSFEVHMQSKAESEDMFGRVLVSDALRKIDELMAVVGDVETAVGLAQQYRGHMVSAFQSLLYFVATTETPLTYTWTDPEQAGVVSRHAIAPGPAQVLYDVLASKQELSEETITLTGKFVDILYYKRRWTLETPDSEQYHGITPEDSNISLNGIVINDATYVVRCREVLEATIGSGRQDTRLELIELTRKT